MKRHTILLFLLALFVSPMSPQTGRFYSTENGLSNSLINAIYQDQKGFVWIATEYGLNKFDGIKFSLYNNIQNDSTSLRSNYVRTVFEDSLGRIFVGIINGLMKYDQNINSFRSVKMYNKSKLVEPHVTGMAEIRNGDIWIVTSGQGLFVMKKGNDSAHFEPQTSHNLSSIYLNSIYKDSKENIWIGSENNGLNLYDAQRQTVSIFREPNAISSDNISAITEDRDGNIFVGTLTKGLNKYNPATHQFVSVPYKDNTQLLISSLLVNKQNQLFIGTDGQGLKLYNSGRNTIEDFEVSSVPFDYSKSKVHAILQDRDENMWLGIFQNGVVFIPKVERKFDYYGYKSLNYNTIGSNSVRSIFKDKNSVTWIGTDSDGMYGINEAGIRVAHFYQTNSPLSVPDIIQCIYEDSDDELWISSYTKGLAKVNRQTGICRYIPRLSNEKVYFITEDRHKNLLIGTYGSGLFMMNIKTGETTHYESSKEETNDLKLDELSNDWINYILCDSEGLIWIGHYKGVSCFDPYKKTFINYLDQNNLLPGNIVHALCEDQQGTIWIGTSAGLYSFDKKKQELKGYTTKDGLVNDMICGIAEDEEGSMWISTFQGLSKYIAAENKFVNYYAGDGLQGNEFTRGAVFKDKNGKIYFGGTSGVTSFYPKDVVDDKKELKLYLTNFLLFNQAIKKGDKSGEKEIVTTSILDAESFTLSYSDNTFTLEFSTLDFANPERIYYQYKIEDVNADWISTYPGVNTITYNNLAPGTYKFHIKACDNNNESAVKTIEITITPPWYFTWWAYLAYALLLILFIIGVINFIVSRIHYRQELLKKEHAEEINEAKLQFFINISHEIRTPMTLIINPLEKLIADNDNSGKQQIYLMIYRNAQRILRLINQLMDIRKLDKGLMQIRCRETDIVGFIEDLMHTFEYAAHKKNIEFVFDHEFDNLKVWIDLNNFDKVMLNIFSNAFKFTPDNGVIQVKLTLGEGDTRIPSGKYFEIRIIDTGIGVDMDKIEKIFERFYQVDQEQINTNFGTGIGLHLSRLLVELHHGIIYAENRDDKKQGAQFIIRLPIGNEHLSVAELKNPKDVTTTIGSLPKPVNVELFDNEDRNNTKHIKAKTKYKVLLVEDEDEIRSYVKNELAPFYKVTECRNGREAMEQILASHFDLIVSDVMMPEMDGITLTRKVRQNINVNHIPIILLTAKTQDRDKIEGLEIGVDAYLGKPFSTEILIQSINNLIASRERLKNKFRGSQEQDDKIARIEMKSSDEILMGKIMKVINENLSNQELNVGMLAANVGMSRVHMHRKLKELTNQSARDFIRGIRLKQAATLLTGNKLTISEVAYATGFANLSHFSNSFKEFYGASPKNYVSRKEEEGNGEE